MKYILALGTNLWDRCVNIKTCTNLLDTHFKVMKVSSIYETKAKLPPKAPHNWDLPYLNCALSVEVENNMRPKEVLKIIQGVELEMGRIYAPNSFRWAPRIIDIDIILAQGISCSDNTLTIPHPQFLQRDFVLVPLKEIEPDFYVPQISKYIKDIELDHLEKSIICRFCTSILHDIVN